MNTTRLLPSANVSTVLVGLPAFFMSCPIYRATNLRAPPPSRRPTYWACNSGNHLPSSRRHHTPPILLASGRIPGQESLSANEHYLTSYK